MGRVKIFVYRTEIIAITIYYYSTINVFTINVFFF